MVLMMDILGMTIVSVQLHLNKTNSKFSSITIRFFLSYTYRLYLGYPKLKNAALKYQAEMILNL